MAQLLSPQKRALFEEVCALFPGTSASAQRARAQEVLDRGYSLEQFDTDVAEAGLRVEQRFATWDVRPWRSDAGFAVSILRSADKS